MSEVREVERLRARVAELEARLATEPARRPAPGRRSAWWGAASAACLVLASILAPVAVASVWASEVLSDTDRYVETVAPLAEDPGVRAAIAAEVSEAVLEQLDIKAVTTDLLQVLATQENVPPRLATALPGLAAPLSQGVESFTRTEVENLLATERFATVWAEVNRISHEQVVTLLEGDGGGLVSAQDATITLNLAPVIATVRDRLVDRGFGLAESIPAVDRSFVLVESDAVADAQWAYRGLHALGTWLPVVTATLLVAGITLARDRRRALLKGALGATLGMLVLGAVLALARTWYVETTPADVLTEASAGSVFDTLVRFLRTSLRAVMVLGLLLALAAFLAGPSAGARRARAGFAAGTGRMRGGARSPASTPGPVSTWTFAHRRGLRIGVAVVAGLALAFWEHPSAGVVVLAALFVVLALALIELLGHPPLAEPEGLTGRGRGRITPLG